MVLVIIAITTGWDNRSHQDLSGFRRHILHGRILINKDGDEVVDGGDVCMK